MPENIWRLNQDTELIRDSQVILDQFSFDLFARKQVELQLRAIYKVLFTGVSSCTVMPITEPRCG